MQACGHAIDPDIWLTRTLAMITHEQKGYPCQVMFLGLITNKPPVGEELHR
jgi:hypothetical protein